MKRLSFLLSMAITVLFCVAGHGQTIPNGQPQRVQHPYYQYDGFIEAKGGILLPRRIANFTPKSPAIIFDTVSGRFAVYTGGWKSFQDVAYTADYNDLINRPDLSQYVPTSRTVNGYPLTSNVTINKVDIGLGNVQNVDVTNGGNITAGTIADARLSANVTLQGNTFNGANQLLQLDAAGKVAYANLPAALMIYKGVWDASTNTPTLADGSGVNGWLYRVSAPGTVDFGSGSISFNAGDYVIYNGSIWQKSGGGDAVVSVNGQQGVVVLSTANISEGGTNYYYTDARVQTFGDARYSLLNHEHVYSDIANLSSYTGFDVRYKSISYVPAWSDITGKPSFATVATSGSYTDLTGTPSLGSLAALSSIGNTYITDVAWSKITGAPSFLTTETDPTIYAWAKASVKPSYSYGEISGTPSLGSLAALSSIGNTYITDVAWAKLTGVPSLLTGTGTAGYVPIWNGINDQGNSIIRADANYVAIGGIAGTYKLRVYGNALFENEIYTSGVWTSGYGPSGSGSAINFKDWSNVTIGSINTTNGNASFDGSITAAGRTRLGAGWVADISGSGNNTGISFGSSMVISTDGTGSYAAKDLGSSGSPWSGAYFTRLEINATETRAKGDIIGYADAAYDIGASSYRFRAGYFSSSITAGSFIGAGTGLNGYATALSVGGTSTSLFNNAIGSAIDLNTISNALYSNYGSDWLTNKPSGAGAYGLVWSQKEGSLGFQQHFDIRHGNTDYGDMWIRILNTSGFSAWSKMLHSNNFNNYVPTLTGTGASGTWGISISGNAATASNSTQWNGNTISGGSSGGDSYIMTSPDAAAWKYSNITQVKGMLGLGSAAYQNTTAFEVPLTFSTGLNRSGNTITNTGVTSIAGTSNQIAVSAATGSVTVSLTNDVVLSGTITSSASYETSDSRLKKLLPGTRLMGKIEALEARLYEKQGRQEYGYFAQDALNIIPTAVKQRADGYYDLSYTQVFVVKIASLEKRVLELETLLQKIYGK